MNDIRNGKFYALTFIFFLLLLGVGGFFLTKSLTKEPLNHSNSNEEVIADTDILKLNKTADYIYFQNDDLKNSSYDINYHEIKININSSDAQNLENTLNNEMSTLKRTYTLISDADLTPEETEKIIYNDSGIYKANYIKYTRYFSKDYVSLLKENYEFDCFTGEKYLSSHAYTFDLNTGKLLNNSKLLSLFNITLDEIKNTINTRLEKKQTLITKPVIEEDITTEEEDTSNQEEKKNQDTEEEKSPQEETPKEEQIEAIDILGTLKNLDNPDNYGLYIDKSGYLTISYLVKTHEIDYNDIIILK